MDIQKIAGLLGLMVGLLWLSISLEQRWSTESEHTKQENINLTLRQVADRMYRLCGDSTSQIPAVRRRGTSNYSVKLTSHLVYDSLPRLLERSLRQHGISDRYTVTIRPCDSEEILLGYISADVQSGVVACTGRDIERNCQELTVSFLPVGKASVLPLIASLLLIAIGGWFVYQYRSPALQPVAKAPIPADRLVTIGQSQYDPHNLSITVLGKSQQLTYRENKLLGYFIDHANQVLTREALQSHVWEDEGVIVGRSLDVFISRLRKLLKPDEQLRITNIHGVGYKLEVGSGV